MRLILGCAIDSISHQKYITDQSVTNNPSDLGDPEGEVEPMKPDLGWTLFLSIFAVAACTRSEPAPEPVRAVRTMTVAVGTAGGTHEYAADVRARVESRLGFRVAGKILDRPVNVGDHVRRGQLLARIDPQDLRLGQDAANAAALAAEVNATQAAADLKRYRNLFDQGFISAAELDRRISTERAARAQWLQAKAQASVQVNQAGYSVLAADAGGVITAVEAEPGSVVSAGAPVVRLAWDGPRDVVFAVPEDQLSPIRALLGKSHSVKVRFWGSESSPVTATVREIAAVADPSTRTFQVKADLGATPVRLGQTASVAVTVPALPGITKLPLTAVMEHQGSSSVWVLDKTAMTVKVQPVQIAGADANEVVVAAGLQAGQTVVVSGVHTLTPGQAVRLYGEPASQPSTR